MIHLEQAIYGEKQGVTSGHDLLSSSKRNLQVFSRISGYTDLADRPEGGVLKEPIIRGFVVEESFLLIKSFPDLEKGLRTGRVFSHALFIDISDLNNLSQVSDLFRLFLAEIDKEASMAPLEFQAGVADSSIISDKENRATESLLENNYAIWLSDQGYWNWIDHIWSQIPIEEKTHLRIGAGFNPQYEGQGRINAIYIPEETRNVWERYDFLVIDNENTTSARSETALWLLGKTQEANKLQTLIDDFSPELNSLSILKRLEDNGHVYFAPGNSKELGPLLTFSNFISRVSSNPREGIKGKENLLGDILTKIPDADINHIKAFSFQTWKGFPNAIERVKNGLRGWLDQYFLAEEAVIASGSILRLALEANSKTWWTITVLDYTEKRFKTWKSKNVRAIWNWLNEEPVLISKHSFWLPENIGRLLGNDVPRLENEVARIITEMAADRGWLVLHAKCIVQFNSPAQAIEEQLCVDRDPNFLDGINALSDVMDSDDFVKIAANNSDRRLNQVAGKLIAGNRMLLNDLDVTKATWQYSWKEAISIDGKVWAGIASPIDIRNQIFILLKSDEFVDNSLLESISTSEYNSLKEIEDRFEIWSVIPDVAYEAFLKATILDLIEDVVLEKSRIHELESEIQEGFRSQELMNEVMIADKLHINSKIQLFKYVEFLNEHHVSTLIESNHFSETSAKELGLIIDERRWRNSAERLYDLRSHRLDLVPALLVCINQLGILNRLSLSWSGLKKDAISPKEQWELFLNKAVKLYPLGPNQNGLWLSAGGDLEVLSLFGNSGKQAWYYAIQHIKNGGNPSIRDLLRVMLREFPGDTILSQLVKTL